jgi:dTDP-glucose pyrophosphorylase
MTLPSSVWRKAILSPENTIKEVIECLNTTGLQIVLIVDSLNVLQGIITDGDIRRKVLTGLNVNEPASIIMYKNPERVGINVQRNEIIACMQAKKYRHMPIVDDNNRLIGLHTWDESNLVLKNKMVIMAGGKGVRMRPYTDNMPKPMLEIQGKPMLQLIIERAFAQGFSEFIISVGYLADSICDYFGDGSSFGVSIEYIHDIEPSGTAGALAMLSTDNKLPVVVTNGDVISHINYRHILDYHILKKADATMAVRVYEWQNPFGVVEVEGVNIFGIDEKPKSMFNISAGIYVFPPSIFESINFGEYIDMPIFINKLIKKNCSVVAYPLHEKWMDVGSPDDLMAANTIGNSRCE